MEDLIGSFDWRWGLVVLVVAVYFGLSKIANAITEASSVRNEELKRQSEHLAFIGTQLLAIKEEVTNPYPKSARM